MKKIVISMLLVFIVNFFMPIYSVFAYQYYLNTSVNNSNSGTFELVWVESSGSKLTGSCSMPDGNLPEDRVTLIATYQTYYEAKVAMDNLVSTEDKVASIIGDREYASNEVQIGRPIRTIIDSQYALVDMDTKGSSSLTTNIYDGPSGSNRLTAINTYGDYGGNAAAFIGFDYGSRRSKIKIAGVTGFVNQIDNGRLAYEIIPISIVKSENYYYVDASGNLRHVLPRNIQKYNCGLITFDLGRAPDYMKMQDSLGKQIRYYSYDGNYFYTSMLSMLDDYKANDTKKAVNSNNPYFNYYMYLPFHVPTSHSIEDMRTYHNYEPLTSANSMYGTVESFYENEAKYGVNAMLSMFHAAHESA